jgi:hypothetical protein
LERRPAAAGSSACRGVASTGLCRYIASATLCTYTTREAGVPKTPLRNIRVPEELWVAALAQAEKEGTTLSEVIRRDLEAYIADGQALRAKKKGA